MTRTIKLTDNQIDLIIYELNQSIRGDDDAYDRKINNIINKLKEDK